MRKKIKLKKGDKNHIIKLLRQTDFKMKTKNIKMQYTVQ